jgi:hypothetical protein
MPANVLQPLFFPDPGEMTYNCISVVRGKRFVAPSTTVITGGPLGTENLNCIEVAVAGARPIGIARFDGAIGDDIPIVAQNIVAPLVAGAAITMGQWLSLDNQGRVIPYVAGGTPSVDPVIVGFACEAQGSAGSDVMVKVTCF